MSATYTYDDGEPGRSCIDTSKGFWTINRRKLINAAVPYIYWLNSNASSSVYGFIPQSMLHKTVSPTDELLRTYDPGGTFISSSI